MIQTTNPQILETPLLAMGKRYVFYSSLLSEASNKYKRLGQYAQSQINHFTSELSMTSENKGGNQIMQALTFLKNSAEFERQKELNFFKHYETAYPEIKNFFNISMQDIEKDYIYFILNINRAIKGTPNLKKIVNSELKRITENRASAAEIYNTNKKITKKTSEEEKAMYEKDIVIYKNIQNVNNARVFFKTTDNNDKSFFNATFLNDDSKRKSVLARVIIENYGVNLFSWKNSKGLQLDERQKNAMIALLTMRANEMFVTDLSNTDLQFETKAKSIITSEHFRTMVNNLLKLPDLTNILNSIIYQYHMQPGSINNLKQQNAKIERIERALKISFDALSQEERKGQSYDDWKKSVGLTRQEISKMITANETIKVQTYYVGEDLAMVDWLANNISAILGGGRNPTDDIQAGTLITTIEVNPKAINTLKSQLWERQAKHFNKIGATSNYESFMNNTKELLAAREEQEKLIQEFLNGVENGSQGLKELVSHINIHSTVKGYESAGSYTFTKEGGFGGAAFGASLDSELRIIDEMAQTGGLDPLDINNLYIAMINCGNLMIGRPLKKTIENYFSAFMGMLMFNDAELFAMDVQRWIKDKTDLGTVQDLHMYQLNGIIVPSSYILEETYKAMSKLQTIDESYRGIQAKFTTYNKEPFPNNWEATSEAAISATKLERMHFLAGFTDLLEDLQERLNHLA